MGFGLDANVGKCDQTVWVMGLKIEMPWRSPR
jgi:hypothetical protein